LSKDSNDILKQEVLK